MSLPNRKIRAYITYVQFPDEATHAHHWVIHKGNYLDTHIAEFNDISQLGRFSEVVGFTFEPVETQQHPKYGEYDRYSISHDWNEYKTYGGFWFVDQVPSYAKPINANVNGKLVPCFFANTGSEITFYRPNPDSKAVFIPLSEDEAAAYRECYGFF